MSMPITFKDGEEELYYIHRHIDHFNKTEAVARFQRQKNQDYMVMRQRYKENYLKNISGVSPKAQAKIALAAEEDSILTALDQSLLDTLNNNVSREIYKYDLGGKMKVAQAALNRFVNTKDLKDLDVLFSQISKASELLRSNPTEIVAAVGRTNWIGSGRDLGKIRKDIQAQINALNNRRVRVGKKETEMVLKELDSLAEGLSADKLNARSLSSILTRIFSTAIGEYIVSKGVIQGLDEVHQQIKDTLVGEKHLKMTDSLQQLLTTYKRENLTFKTDNSFQDIELELEDGEEFKINLGLSTKWYQGIGKSDSDSVTVTSESHFTEKVSELLSGDSGKYYIYNALALVDQDGTAYAALKASVVARAADFIISGFGEQGDFAQFIVINGTFYSIWQIILALQMFNSGQGHSWMSSGRTDPITVSPMGLTNVTKLTKEAQDHEANLYQAYKRAKAQNGLIEDLAMGGHFYPQRLANALSKMK